LIASPYTFALAIDGTKGHRHHTYRQLALRRPALPLHLDQRQLQQHQPDAACQGNRALQSTEFSRRRARFREVESQHHEEFIENLFDLDAVAVVAVA